jgi:hypothetical protein
MADKEEEMIVEVEKQQPLHMGPLPICAPTKNAKLHWKKRERKRKFHLEQNGGEQCAPDAPLVTVESARPAGGFRTWTHQQQPSAQQPQPQPQQQPPEAIVEAERQARLGAEALLSARTREAVEAARSIALKERASACFDVLDNGQHHLVGLHSCVVLAVPGGMDALEANQMFEQFVKKQNRPEEVRPPALMHEHVHEHLEPRHTAPLCLSLMIA